MTETRWRDRAEEGRENRGTYMREMEYKEEGKLHLAINWLKRAQSHQSLFNGMRRGRDELNDPDRHGNEVERC